MGRRDADGHRTVPEPAGVADYGRGVSAETGLDPVVLLAQQVMRPSCSIGPSEVDLDDNEVSSVTPALHAILTFV